MRRILFFKRLKESFRADIFNLSCVFLMALFIGACASGEYKKKTSSHADETGQVSAKDESENAETDDSQKIECRTTQSPGSRLKTKTCLPKWQWAAIDEEKKEKSGQFVRDVEQDSRRSLDSGMDSMGGVSSGMPRP
ncbi:MAG: hypothetical protein JW896_08990 [Deltaproteobacteria bacterium]|nr:hypothetical protein [Deltaproteobacteria bacterium]